MNLPSQSLVGAGALGKRGGGHVQTWTLVLSLLSLPDGFIARTLGLFSVLDTSCHSGWRVTLWVSLQNMQSQASSVWWLWCILRTKGSFKGENRNHWFSIPSVNYYYSIQIFIYFLYSFFSSCIFMTTPKHTHIYIYTHPYLHTHTHTHTHTHS